jgi:hypothetical protein
MRIGDGSDFSKLAPVPDFPIQQPHVDGKRLGRPRWSLGQINHEPKIAPV